MTQRTGFAWQWPLLVGLTIFVPAGHARSIYVDSRARGADNGTSWNDAYLYLQDALAAAQSGDRILVAQGTYRPDLGRAAQAGDRAASFSLKTGVTLRGGYAGSSLSSPDARNVRVYASILSGDLAENDRRRTSVWDLSWDPRRAENSYHVVTADRVTGAVLDGFHIAGGRADGESGTPSGGGGAVYLANGAAATLAGCTLTANYGRLGGALYSSGASPLLMNCEFRENLAEFGGGLAVRMGSASLLGCSFRRNGAAAGGGAIWSDVCEGRYINCSICGNAAMDSGGGVNAQDSTLEMTNCLLCGNTAACSGGALNAGGCPHGSGAGGSEIAFLNCTLADNRAGEGRAVQCFSDASTGQSPSNIRVGNGILRNGGDEIRINDDSMVQVTFSNVQGNYGDEGNIDVDPPFASAGSWNDRGTPDDLVDDVWTEGDYRLPADSPCVDVGYGRFVPLDTMDLDTDGDTSEIIPKDIRGRVRMAEKPGRTGDLDLPAQPRVDMGAYEYQDSRTVFRFWSPVLSRYFYTVSDLERKRLIREFSDVWTYEEGAGYETFADGSNPDTRPVHRFWWPGNNTHFYTIHEQEKQLLIDEYSDVWVYEGTVFYAHAEGQQPGLARPVHRFWSPTLYTHFYTVSESERDELVAESSDTWTYEGIAWYAYELSTQTVE